jgi:hypothetical protein
MVHTFKNLEYDYKTAKTEDLLHTFRTLRIIQNIGIAEGCFCGICDGSYRELEQDERVKLDRMVNAMKLELSHRPHVPNKKEKKELRRMAAQGKLN